MRLLFVCTVFTSYLLLSNPTLAQHSETPLITVSGSAIEFVPVDELHFTINIEVQDIVLPVVRQQNKAIAKKVFSYLSEVRIPNQYIQTKTMNVDKKYDHRNGSRRLLGFQARQSIYVCLKDISLFDKVLDSLLTMENVSISGPEYRSSQYKDAYMKAKIAAVQNAKQKAKLMAESIDQSIGKAKSIHEETTKSVRLDYDGSSPQNDNDPNVQSIRVGQLKVSANVIVAFELL